MKFLANVSNSIAELSRAAIGPLAQSAEIHCALRNSYISVKIAWTTRKTFMFLFWLDTEDVGRAPEELYKEAVGILQMHIELSR